MPVLRSVMEDISSIAAVRSIRIHVAGTCASEIRVAEPRLRLAFQYLILAMIERQPAGSAITLFLGEGPAGALLRARCDRPLGVLETGPFGNASGNARLKRDSIGATIRRVRMAIAVRILAGAGAFLAFDDGAPGFVLRIPRSCGVKPGSSSSI
jgi:hypothetical protein